MLQSQSDQLYSQMNLRDHMFLNEPKLLQNYYLMINDSKGKKKKPRTKTFQRMNLRDNND